MTDKTANKDVLSIYIDNLDKAVPVKKFEAGYSVYKTNDDRYVLVDTDFKIMGKILTEKQYQHFVKTLAE